MTMKGMMASKEELFSMTDRQVAALYTCSIRTVQRWRKRLNVKRPGWGPGKLDMEKARRIRSHYFVEGLTQQEIADLYGVSQAAIGRVVNNVTYAEKVFGLVGESTCVFTVKE